MKGNDLARVLGMRTLGTGHLVCDSHQKVNLPNASYIVKLTKFSRGKTRTQKFPYGQCVGLRCKTPIPVLLLTDEMKALMTCS